MAASASTLSITPSSSRTSSKVPSSLTANVPSPPGPLRTGADRAARLEGLLDLPASELAQLYRDARVPNLGDVRGDLRGRMLAWPWVGTPAAARILRRFAGADVFPWRGKTFVPNADATRGEGDNRVVSERFHLFRFETFVGPSRAGSFDAVQLDYDLPDNPPVIRSIKDEIRELEPGVWLGQAWLRTRSRERLWLYFALADVGTRHA